MQPAVRILPAAIVAATVFSASAAAELVTLQPRPGVELRLGVEVRGNERAVALLFAGGHGKIMLDEAGQPRGLRGNFLIRARGHLAARGIGLVLVDAPSDSQGEEGLWPHRMTQEHADDIGQAVNFAKRRFGRPVWLVGTSAGTLSVANAAARLSHADRPDGIVLTSTITRPPRRRPLGVFDVNLAAIRGPALVVAHEQDGCFATPASDAPRLLAALAGAQPKKLAVIASGLPPQGPPCEALSAHGFLGVEGAAMSAVAAMILEAN